MIRRCPTVRPADGAFTILATPACRACALEPGAGLEPATGRAILSLLSESESVSVVFYGEGAVPNMYASTRSAGLSFTVSTAFASSLACFTAVRSLTTRSIMDCTSS